MSYDGPSYHTTIAKAAYWLHKLYWPLELLAVLLAVARVRMQKPVSRQLEATKVVRWVLLFALAITAVDDGI
eukprot:4484766-Pleurochrysis_carterae.AAC.6